MKSWKKILICIIVLIFIAWIVSAVLCNFHQKRIWKYSTFCMDEVRNQLWEYVLNVSNMYEWKNNWYYLYSWNVSYEWLDYVYFCKVLGKDNVTVLLTGADSFISEESVVEVVWEEISIESDDTLNELISELD